MAPFRRWLDPLLHDAYDQAEKDQDRRKQLHTSLALLPVDASQVRYLDSRLLDAEAGEVSVLRDALAPHKDGLVDKLWVVAGAPDKGKEAQRLRAAAALAKYDPESPKWATCSPRSLATNLLADYATDNHQLLADLLMDADEKQFAVIYAKLREHGEKGLALLTSEIDRKLPSELPLSAKQREKLARRQTNAAVALLRMNQPEKVWPLLKHSPDPRVRSYLIHRLSRLGTDVGALVTRLDEEPDVTIRRALVLSLGEYSEHELSSDLRKTLLPKLQTLYRSEADSGLHGAVEWLLRQGDEKEWLQQVNEEWAKDKEQREKRLRDIRQLLIKDQEKPRRSGTLIVKVRRWW